ncbi:MAG: hypothetical protein JWR88_773 [Pseudonocardia sp.]|nr:hypothetical protein [Pseudonocardia sp.]
MASSTHHLVTAMAAGLRCHPDLDIIVADNLRDRPYYIDGTTIYIDGTLSTVAATQALLAALSQLNTDPTFDRPDDDPPATVIPLRDPRTTPDNPP